MAAPIHGAEDTTAETAVSGDLLSAAVGMREAFGLSADPDYVLALMTSQSDVGTEAWGIPLTAREMQALKLDARASFQVTSQAVLDFAQSVPEFGGAYFDQREGGELILQFTALTDETQARISQLASTDGPSTRTVTVQYSFAELRDAMSAAPAVIEAIAPSVQPISVGIREPENSLVAEVLYSPVSMSQLEANVTSELGVPIAIQVASGPLMPGSCSQRDLPCNPEQAGVRISFPGVGCTMGFAITNGSDRQFITAGHCGGPYWYQPNTTGYYLGQTASNLYPGNSVDMERIQFPDSWASTSVFGEGSRFIYGRSNPQTGELVYGSLGYANAVRSGTVYTAWGSYYAEGHWLEGTNVHQLVTQGGDSGSPLYLRSCCSRLYALATYSAGNSVDRWWARVIDGVVAWSGWDIYH